MRKVESWSDSAAELLSGHPGAAVLPDNLHQVADSLLPLLVVLNTRLGTNVWIAKSYLPFEVLTPIVVIASISALGPPLDFLDLPVRLEGLGEFPVLTL